MYNIKGANYQRTYVARKNILTSSAGHYDGGKRNEMCDLYSQR